MTVQAMSALDQANEIRLERARLMKPMNQPRPGGHEYAARMLEDLPDALHSMYAWQFVNKIHRLQRRTWFKWLSRLQISETRPLGLLTQRQRNRLAEMIREHAHR